MDKTRMRRVAAAVVVIVAMTARAGLAFAGSPITLNTNAVAPGGVVEVSGTGCSGTRVQIAVTSAGSSIASPSATPDATGSWLAAVLIPAVSTPGVYNVTATCRQANNETLTYDQAQVTVTGRATGGRSGFGNVDQISTKLFLAALVVVGLGVLSFVVERAMRPQRRRRRGQVKPPTSWSPPQPR